MARSSPVVRVSGPARGAARSRQELQFDFLRQTHIFASAIRETLEEGPLRRATRHPLSISQYHLLRLLALNGVHRVNQAAEFLGVSAPAITRNIDKLEALGLVRRESSRDDRRSTLLSVTSAGRELVRACDRQAASRVRQVLARFDPAELRRFALFMERVSVELVKCQPDAGACLRCAAFAREHCPINQAVGGCTYQALRRAHVEDSEDVASR